MNKIVRFSLLFLLLNGCFASYPTTSFWVYNNSDTTVHFRGTVLKYNSMGPYTMSLPFTVEAGDSVLFRRVGFRPDGNPAQVGEIEFLSLNPHLNNPGDSINWIRYNDSTSEPGYVFYIYPYNQDQ